MNWWQSSLLTIRQIKQIQLWPLTIKCTIAIRSNGENLQSISSRKHHLLCGKFKALIFFDYSTISFGPFHFLHPVIWWIKRNSLLCCLCLWKVKVRNDFWLSWIDSLVINQFISILRGRVYSPPSISWWGSILTFQPHVHCAIRGVKTGQLFCQLVVSF